MASPGGTIIGRISVKVLPDTDDFRKDAKKQLKAIEKNLTIKAKIVAKVDSASIKAEAKKAQEEVKAALKSVTISVNLENQDQLKGALARLRAELDRLDHTSMKVELDRESLTAAIGLYEEQLQKVATLDLRVDDNSFSSVQRAIARINAELAAIREIDLSVKLDEASLLAARAKLTAQLKDLARLDLKVNNSSMASVKSAIAKIDAELSKIEEIDIKVKLDKESLLKAKAELQDRLDTEARIKVALDKAAAQKVFDSVQAELSKVKISPTLDSTAVAKAKRELEAAFIKVEELKATITPEMDVVARRKVEHEIDDLKDKCDKIKAEIKPDVSAPLLLRAAQQLAWLSRTRVVQIMPKLSQKGVAQVAVGLAALSGARFVADSFKDMVEWLGRLDKVAPIIGTVGLGIVGLAGYALTAAANIVTFVGSLASIAPAALALPGIFGGLAIGIGVSFAALKDFNKIVPEVKNAFKGLQDQISVNFWSMAAQPIRDLVTGLLPQLTNGLKGSATALGGYFGSLATSLKGAFDGALASMFANLNKSILIAAGGTNFLAGIMKTLGDVGASYLPALAQWFVDITKQFDGFLKAAAADGRLKQWIDNGIAALSALGSVLWNIGTIFYGVFKAAQAAGGSTLQMMADTLKNISDTVNSPGFQAGLTTVFKSAFDMMSAISATAGPALSAMFQTLGQTLAGIMPVAGNAIGTLLNGLATALSNPALQNGLGAMFGGIASAATSLGPVFTALGPALGAIASTIGSILTALGPLVSAVFVPLGQAITALAPAIQPLIAMLGGALTQVFQALGPVILQVVGAFTSLLSGGLLTTLQSAIAQILPVVMQLAPVIGQLLVAAISALAPILQAIVPLFAQVAAVVGGALVQLLPQLIPIITLIGTTVGQLITAIAPLVTTLLDLVFSIITPLIPIVMNILSAVLPPLVAAINLLVQALLPVIKAIAAVVGWLLDFLAPVITWLATVIITSFIDIIKGIGLVFRGVTEYVMGIWNVFAGLFTGDWDRVWGGLKQMFLGIWDIICGAFDIIINIGILGVAKKGLALLKGAWEGIWTGIKLAAELVWGGIKMNWEVFVWALKEAPGKALEALINLFKSCWRNISDTAEAAWRLVKDAFMNGVNGAIGFVMGLPDKLLSIFKGAQTLLSDIGGKIIDGLVNGIKGAIGNVKKILTDLTGWIKDWKGPESLDRVLLVKAGQLIIDGFINGLESRYDAVRKSLAGLTDDIGDTVITAPSVQGGSVSSAARAAVDAVISKTMAAAGGQKVLNYYAAPNNSLDSEEDLFAAAGRARMVGW